MESTATYYRDHWISIEPERIEAYEQMFRWRPEMEPLIAGAEIGAGHVALDYGCGPGWLAIELARRVGASGHVHAVDINAEMIARGERHAADEGVAERVTFHHSLDDRLPVADRSVDRVITKNVLEYVSDLHATLVEMRRVLRPGGRLHVIDSDWGMLAVEPLGAEMIAELFVAASIAYKTPLIGRKLYGAMRAAGFQEVRVQVVASADTRGHFAPIISNMAAYARASARLTDEKIDRVLRRLKDALDDGTYLLILPQFLVTGSA